MKHKKSYRHIRKKSTKEIVAFIEKYKSIYTVKLICKALNFSRSTYYKALVNVPSNREIEANKLKLAIKNIWLESKSIYDATKIQNILSQQGKKLV